MLSGCACSQTATCHAALLLLLYASVCGLPLHYYKAFVPLLPTITTTTAAVPYFGRTISCMLALPMYASGWIVYRPLLGKESYKLVVFLLGTYCLVTVMGDSHTP